MNEHFEISKQCLTRFNRAGKIILFIPFYAIAVLITVMEWLFVKEEERGND